MTIKEIAETAGCSDKTVKRIVAEKFPGKMQNGKVTRFSWEEAHQLMEVLPKRNMVSHLGQTSSLPSSNVLGAEAVGSTLTDRDLQMISTIVAMTIQKLDVRMSRIEERVEERQALLPAPKMSDKDAIRQMVAREASASGRPHAEVWNDLYARTYYLRMGNFKQQAKNVKASSVIDYVDQIGMAGKVLAVAIDLWGAK